MSMTHFSWTVKSLHCWVYTAGEMFIVYCLKGFSGLLIASHSMILCPLLGLWLLALPEPRAEVPRHGGIWMREHKIEDVSGLNRIVSHWGCQMRAKELAAMQCCWVWFMHFQETHLAVNQHKYVCKCYILIICSTYYQDGAGHPWTSSHHDVSPVFYLFQLKSREWNKRCH